MHPEEAPVAAIVERLVSELGSPPPTAIVLGSGLGVVADRMVVEKRVGTVDVGLPQSTVTGHAGELLKGTLGGASVLLMSGRVHLYEGYSAAEVIRYVRVLHRWGVKRLILTCSVGGVDKSLTPGDILLVTDHINFQQSHALVGPTWGDYRFPDMGSAYDSAIREVLDEAAKEVGVDLRHGAYAASTGPSYETPTETRFLRMVGVAVVGMSTVPEVLAAVQTRLPVAAVAIVSNLAADLSETPLNHEEVTEMAGEVGSKVADIFERACSRF